MGIFYNCGPTVKDKDALCLTARGHNTVLLKTDLSEWIF